jgi:hypothetical protein
MPRRDCCSLSSRANRLRSLLLSGDPIGGAVARALQTRGSPSRPAGLVRARWRRPPPQPELGAFTFALPPSDPADHRPPLFLPSSPPIPCSPTSRKMADVKTSKVDTTTDMEHTDDQKFVVPGASLTPPPSTSRPSECRPRLGVGPTPLCQSIAVHCPLTARLDCQASPSSSSWAPSRTSSTRFFRSGHKGSLDPGVLRPAGSTGRAGRRLDHLSRQRARLADLHLALLLPILLVPSATSGRRCTHPCTCASLARAVTVVVAAARRLLTARTLASLSISLSLAASRTSLSSAPSSTRRPTFPQSSRQLACLTTPPSSSHSCSGTPSGSGPALLLPVSRISRSCQRSPDWLTK